MFKKIAAIALALTLCLLAVGCSKDEAPDGMHNVTAEGQPFVLYVPNSWADNSVSGISGAHVTTAEGGITVSARFYARGAEVTLDTFTAECLASYSSYAKEYQLVSNEASVLGGADAKEIIYTAKNGDVDYTFRHRIAKHSTAQGFVVLSFNCPTASYETTAEQFALVANAFVLCDMPERPNDNVTDKKTPVGMKIASADHLEYRLYVPESWVCSSESGRSEAYVDKDGKPNITVTSYSPDGDDTTVESYWATCETEYKQKLSNYEFIGSEERTVADRAAVSYTYTAAYDGVKVKLMQTVTVYNGMVYSVTYTAREADFDAHLGEVNGMLDVFIFR